MATKRGIKNKIMTPKRGVRNKFGSLDIKSEVVCDCDCHEPQYNMKHFIDCCGVPTTEAGIEILKNYIKE